MAALQGLGIPEHGSQYTNWDACVAAIRDWSVKEKFNFRTPTSNPERKTWICREEGCGWKCLARKGQDGVIRLNIAEKEHTCIPDSNAIRAASCKKEFMDEKVAQHLRVSKTTVARDIQEVLSIQYGEEVKYDAAFHCLKRLQNDDLGEQRYSFQLLPAYRNAVLTRDPQATVHVAIHSRTGNFGRCFVCPSVSAESFRLCRRFLAADGTFLKSKFVQTLLLAVGIDANGHALVLAWAVVESENAESWAYFFKFLRQAIPCLTEEVFTFISDRDKGIEAAEVEMGSKMQRALCCYHLEKNFTGSFGVGLRKLFWSAARAKTEHVFDKVMAEIKAAKPAAEQYLRDVDPYKWTTLRFPGRRFGHYTSNVAESCNKLFTNERELAVVRLLDEIWHKIMVQRMDRLEAANQAAAKKEQWTSVVTAALNESKKWTHTNHIQRSTPQEARVVQQDGVIRIVDLVKGTCTCQRYQVNGIPCGHALKAIYATKDLRVTDFLPDILSVARQQAIYAAPIPVIDIVDLKPLDEEECNPPKTRIPRGRPKRKREERATYRASRGLRKDNVEVTEAGEAVIGPEGSTQRRKNTCKTCGQTGHNTRTCKTPHN